MEHVAHAEQVRSEEVVAGVDAKVWFETHVVRLAQTRSADAVSGLDWNCCDEHTVAGTQLRSEVVVAGKDSYWAAVHVVRRTPVLLDTQAAQNPPKSSMRRQRRKCQSV